MEQTGVSRLSVVVLLTNLCLELLLLWVPQPSLELKGGASAMLILITILSLQPRMAVILRGGTYVLLVLLALMVTFVEYWIATQIVAPLHLEFAFTPFEAAQFALLYTVLVGLPVIILTLQAREFALLSQIAASAQETAPTETDALIRQVASGKAAQAGGQSGCSIQVVLFLVLGLVGIVGEFLFSRQAIAPVVDTLLVGLAGPAYVLMGGLVRATVDFIIFPVEAGFVIWLATILAEMLLGLGLTVLLNVQFVLISRIATRRLTLAHRGS